MIAFHRPARVALLAALSLCVIGLSLLPGGTQAAPQAAPATQISLGGWSPVPGGGEASSLPTAISWGPERLDLFVRGRDGRLFQNYLIGNRWDGWRVPGAFGDLTLRSAPSCASWNVNRISCVALVEGSERVWHMLWDGVQWSLEDLGGTAASAPAIVSPNPNQLAVFVVGGGQKLYGRAWAPGGWSGWAELDPNGRLGSAPACAGWSSRFAGGAPSTSTAPGTGSISCLAVGGDRRLYLQLIGVRGNALSAGRWVELGRREQGGNDLTIGSAPTIVAVAADRAVIFLLNRGQSLYYATLQLAPSVSQSDWQRVADDRQLGSPPGCVVLAPGRASCFARGVDNPLFGFGTGELLQAGLTVGR